MSSFDTMAENNGEYRGDNGKFKEGNPGKPKGAVTKVSLRVRESLVKFMEDNIDSIQESFDELSAKEKLEFISGILSYAVPKLSATQVETEHSGGITIEFKNASDYIYPTQDQGDNGIPESI